MTSLFQCGYVRTNISNGLEQIHHTSRNKRFQSFADQFSVWNFKINESYFHRKSKDLHVYLRKTQWNGQVYKEIFTEHFSLENWQKLSEEEQKAHTLNTCNKCLNEHNEILSSVPTVRTKKSSKQTLPHPPTPGSIEVPLPENELEKTPKFQVAAASDLFREVSQIWENNYKTPFTEVIRKVPEAKLTPRKTKIQKQKELRKIHRKCKRGLQDIWQNNNRDLETFYGTRQSGSSLTKHRSSLFFETKERTLKRAATPNANGPAKQKRHSQDPYTVSFDKAALLEEVNSLEKNSQLNLSALARKYGIMGPTGNMVVKEFLLKEGVNLDEFESKISKHQRTRRRYERLPGSDITVPIPRSYQKIKEALKQGLEDGTYSIGDLVEPKTFTKFKIEDGVITKEEYTVCGRKIPIHEIRRQLFKSHKETGIMRNVGNAERMLATWIDHSNILSTGHLLFTIRALYTPELFYTDDEMSKNTGRPINVQELVESPMIYILGQTNDSLSEKLSYTETRLEDIKEMRAIKIGDCTINDTLRFFIGDHPEIQSESGNSQGGNYPCMCGCHVKQFSNLCAAFSHKIESLETRRLKITQGKAGRKVGAIRPLENLKSSELLAELTEREIKPLGKTKKALEDSLKQHMRGIIGAPAICFGNEKTPLKDLGLPHYEVSPIEPLHDIKGHIKNIWEALPELLDDSLKKTFKEILETCYGNKTKVRGADYRFSVIVVNNLLRDKVTEDISMLLETLLEIGELTYSPAKNRTPKFLLRLFNVTFQHAMLCCQLFNNVSAISSAKMYGIYFHSIVTHLPEVARIIAPSSLHSENEERLFSDLNSIAKGTSSRTQESIRDTCIVRMQFEMKWNRSNSLGKVSKLSLPTKISQFSKAVETPKSNSTFDLLTIDEPLFQLHLQRISQFLLPGEGIWWHKNSTTKEIIFHDGTDEPNYREEGPILANFTTTSLSLEHDRCFEIWNQCLSSDVVIPISKIRNFDTEGNLMSTTTDNTVEFDEELEETLEVVGMEDKERQEDCTLHEEQQELNEKDEGRNQKSGKEEHEREITSNSSCHKFKSRTSALIYDILGTSNELLLFDHYHDMFKEKKTNFAAKKCKELQSHLKNNILQKNKQDKELFKTWETNFFQEHGRAPLINDVQKHNDIEKILNRLKIAKKILNIWR